MIKRIIATAFALIVSVTAFAAQPEQDGEKQIKPRPWRIGVTGTASLMQVDNYGSGVYAYFDPELGWSAGLAFQYKWGGFLNYSIQPELRYSVNRTDIEPVLFYKIGTTSISTIDLPVAFQFGVQLSPIFRPFVAAGLDLSYIVGQSGELFDDDLMPLNRFNFGLSAGFGFDLWKFQFSARYRFGLTNVNANAEVFERVKFTGCEFSIAILF